jgi:quinolinate synthase
MTMENSNTQKGLSENKSLMNIEEKKLLAEKIRKLKEEKNAIILAHYYQEAAIQDVADYIGDSFGLSQEAAKTNADIIVFAGVHFMAETAKILSPQKKVLLPDLNAGCSLADSCPPDLFKEFIDLHPGSVVVTYINCSAEIKALSDIICTSSNAVKVINSVPKDKNIIFAPDVNLGRFLRKVTGRELILWNGACIVHDSFSIEKLGRLKKDHPDSLIIAHPECSTAVLEYANYIDSTAGLLKYTQTSSNKKFIVVTEEGIIHQMRKFSPDKTFIPAPVIDSNECACGECPYMKVNTLEKLYKCLENETPEIILEESLYKQAKKPIQKMLTFA